MGYFRKLAIALMFVTLPAAAQVSAPQADGTTPLQSAAYSDDLPAVQRLLRSGANPNAANRYGVTPLFLAATNGNAVMIETLLKAGANPQANLPGAQTILMTAP